MHIRGNIKFPVKRKITTLKTFQSRKPSIKEKL